MDEVLALAGGALLPAGLPMVPGGAKEVGIRLAIVGGQCTTGVQVAQSGATLQGVVHARTWTSGIVNGFRGG